MIGEISKAELETLINIPFDYEILGSLYYQAKEFHWIFNFPKSAEKGQKWDEFMKIIANVSMKIYAMKYHMGNYKKFESMCIQQLTDACLKNGEATLQGYELLYELEAFLFQIKSVLDMSVKFI